MQRSTTMVLSPELSTLRETRSGLGQDLVIQHYQAVRAGDPPYDGIIEPSWVVVAARDSFIMGLVARSNLIIWHVLI